ncbi:MAG: 50S ribosomal protein L3 [bacterium]
MIGRKKGMTRLFSGGAAMAVTLIEAGPCVVTDIRTKDRNGYEAVQLGYEETSKEQRLTRPVRGHFKKKGLPCFRVIREFRMDDPEGNCKVGDRVTVDIFKEGSRVKVTGTSKGCGFTGAMKRWGFRGAPASHGASKVHRKPMSAGATDPARVFKGKRSPGRLGGEKVSVRNLEVVAVDPEKNILAVRGAVPGKRNSLVLIYRG